MNWNGLAAWVYENDTPDFAKAKKHNIETIYVDPRSPNAGFVCQSVRGNGLTAGIYYAPNWFPGPTPQAHAKIVSDYVQKDGIIIIGEPVMVDLEELSIPWVNAFLGQLRKYLPSRPLAYTNEPFQNQTVIPVETLQQFGLHWYVQLYDGDMTPVDAAAAMMEVARIYPPDQTHPFYDGARLPVDARDGAVFTLERLPA